jgi:hypothetical protein
VQDVALLDYRDQELDRLDPRHVIAAIVEHLRRVHPDVVITFGRMAPMAIPITSRFLSLRRRPSLRLPIPRYQALLHRVAGIDVGAYQSAFKN